MKELEKLAIHELLGRASYGLDERDLTLLESCFAPEAIFIINIEGADPIPPFEGREAIMKLMTDSMEAQTDKRRHIASNIFFESEGKDEAMVVSNLTLYSIENGDIRLVSSGIYRDKVVKVDDSWRISVRDLHLDLPY